MSNRHKTLRQLIARSRGVKDANEFFQFELEDLSALGESARSLMSEVPPAFGACVMLSSSWAGYLRERHGIPAIAVAGDVRIEGSRIFKYKQRLPEAGAKGKVVRKVWSGHCWIEVNGFLGDISIFRTAYAIDRPSVLKEFVLRHFGPGRGAFVSRVDDLPPGMQYTPKEVLNDRQVDMFIRSLGWQLENGI